MGYEVLTYKGVKIILEDKPVSKPGGEGEVRKIISPVNYTKYCVKIYHEGKRTKEKEGKIRFMIENTPTPPAQVQSMLMIGWPIETIYHLDKEFIGFMMPLAFPGSEKLKDLTKSPFPKKLSGDWLKFRWGNDLKYRYKLMLNISGFMYLLHHTGKYILGDFKPDNVLVTSSGQVTIIDMDSIQISEGYQLLFPGAAATANYRPPEYYTGIGKTANTPLAKSWDCFSLSVVFYELLLGLHPYSGCTPKFQRATNTFVDNIRDDLFPFGSNANKIEGYPPPHDEFKKLPINIKNLFIQSFTPNENQRPSVGKWSEVIREIIKDNSPSNPQEVKLNQNSLIIKVNDYETLTAKVNPSSTNQSLEWSSDNPSVATVDKNGTVAAVKAGTAKITVMSAIDRTKSATCTVTVQAIPVPSNIVNSIHLDSKTLELYEKQHETLTVDVLPSNATNKTVIWSSSNKQIASVNNGKVTAVKAGKAVITVKSTDGSNKSADCEVIVKKKINWRILLFVGLFLLIGAGIYFFFKREIPPSSVSLGTSSLSLVIGSTEQQPLTVTIEPAKAKNKNVTWSSSNPAVAEVSAQGVVTAKSAGTATITVITEDGGKSAVCEVSVTVGVTSVRLNKSSLSLVVGRTEQLRETITPANATNKTATWKSSNQAVATIDQGFVRAVSEGTATITVTTADGNRTSDCVVTVVKNGNDIVTIQYPFGRYEGRVVNGIPEGHGGTMTYTCRVQIAKREGGRTYYAEKGDYFTGKWHNGDIEFGNLFDSNGIQKFNINVGRRPNPYDLRNDRCE